MWTFEVKTSTLLVMMMTLVVVYSATTRWPDPCEYLPHQMKDELQKLKNAMLDNINVPKPSPDKKCPKKFFCLAEKVLEHIEKESVKTTLSDLTQMLKQFNQKCNTTSCVLKKNGNYRLQSFLKNIDECLNYTIHNKA